MVKDKAALKSFRAKQHLPFETFEDVPESETGEVEEKPFLQCHYNETEKAYRSPWTSRYYKIIVVGDEEEIDIYEKETPEDEKKVRDIEYAANEVWDAYTNLYYGKEAVGSTFLRPRGDKGSFEGMYGIHKHSELDGSWDSVHLVQVDQPNEKDKTCDYRVESAVVCSVAPYNKTSVSCSFTKETAKTCKVRFSSLTGSHLENLGLIMEQVEIDFRSKMERVDMPKTLEVIESIYRKHKPSATAHLMGGGEPVIATGMGVGAGMIGEIASMAKSKKGAGGANPFMDAMQKNLKAREAKKTKDGDDGGEGFLDMKSTLKKSGGTRPPPPKAQPATTEFMDFRKNLKKTGKK
jgi:hypothetical protein